MIKLKTVHNETFRCISVDASEMDFFDFIREAYPIRNAFKDSGLRSKAIISDKTLLFYYDNDEIQECINLIRKVSSESNASARSNTCNRSREEEGRSVDPQAIGERMAGGESRFRWEVDRD